MLGMCLVREGVGMARESCSLCIASGCIRYGGMWQGVPVELEPNGRVVGCGGGGEHIYSRK